MLVLQTDAPGIYPAGKVFDESRGDNPQVELDQARIDECAAALMESRGPHVEAITQLTRGR